MVSNTLSNGAEDKGCGGVPEGRYRLVGWDIDTTGRRLIDEICQIAAYTPNSQFAQYIMPYAALNPYAQRRHNIKVVTINRFRLLKDLKTNKFLKTKSEVSALADFLAWLEETKGDATDGIILGNGISSFDRNVQLFQSRETIRWFFIRNLLKPIVTIRV